MRLYIGSKKVFVSPGKHTYEIRYTTNYQLGYFDSHDELYWNVTGNGWEFAIEQVSADVTLPAEAPLAKVTHESYTGREGAQGRNASSTANQTTGQVNFQATQPLLPHEGLTIVVGFPKGLVRVPAATERGALYLSLRDNVILWIALGGLLTVLLYYITAWSLVGRDPIGDVIVPRFESPQDLSPACIRYLWRMDYDRTCFTVAVLNMAAKGRLAIKEQDSTFSLSRIDSAAQQKLADGEQAVMKKLLTKGDARSIVLMQANHKKIKKSIEALSDCLAREFDGKLFLKHRKWLVIGWLLSALFVVAAWLSSQARSESMQDGGLQDIDRAARQLTGGTIIGLVGLTFLACSCCPFMLVCASLAKSSAHCLAKCQDTAAQHAEATRIVRRRDRTHGVGDPLFHPRADGMIAWMVLRHVLLDAAAAGGPCGDQLDFLAADQTTHHRGQADHGRDRGVSHVPGRSRGGVSPATASSGADARVV